MNVHEAISEHSRKQHRHLEAFVELDMQREAFIDEALDKCGRNEAFSVDAINRITKRINDLAHSGISPARTCVTEDMIREYAGRLKRKR